MTADEGRTVRVPERVVVVGGNIAALRAVQTLRRVGFAGSITLVSDEAHLPYNRPPLSKGVLSGEIEPAATALTDRPALEALGVELRLGTAATGLDLNRRDVILGDERIGFDAVVVATGASARRLPRFDGLDGVSTLRTLDDALELRAAFEKRPRVLVIGAGFIGSEVASTACDCGLEVTIVDVLGHPMVAAIGDEMAGRLAGLHTQHGATLKLRTTVEALEGDGRVERAVLSDGTTVDVDVVVVGIGVVPNTGWLAGSGLQLANGVICDATLNAGVEGVYAVGDIAWWPNELLSRSARIEHWTTAGDHGAHVARILATGEAAPFVDCGYVWSDQHGIKFQVVGVTRDADEVIVVDGDLDERKFVAWYRKGDRLAAALGASSPGVLFKSRRLIEQRASWAEALSALSG